MRELLRRARAVNAEEDRQYGPSLHLWGNPSNRLPGLPTTGSIPALAGEPPNFPGARSRCWVYPRACGGTILESWDGQSNYGLSPRLRGNHEEERGNMDESGSIPALAGEPSP